MRSGPGLTLDPTGHRKEVQRGIEVASWADLAFCLTPMSLHLQNLLGLHPTMSYAFVFVSGNSWCVEALRTSHSSTIMDQQLRRMNSGRLAEASGHLHVRVINRTLANYFTVVVSASALREIHDTLQYSHVEPGAVCGHFRTVPNSAAS